MVEEGDNLKRRVAGTIKWNLIDRLAQQALYAVTGIVLARMLSPEEFGLIGALVVFQAFAMMMVDSGFSSALIQRKHPAEGDYSTIFWFNFGTATALYALLWVLLPWIADLFGGDERLVPLGRVLFLSLPLNSAGIVQANRMMKAMNVRPVAVCNSLGLIAGAVAGIYMAVCGNGAWSIVGQTLALAAVKNGALWIAGRWKPQAYFSWERLRGFFVVGSGVMATSFLNTLFQNICSFFVGNRAGLAVLGVFTQADKWSKMGVMSLSQTFTSSFLPALSAVQDDPVRLANHTRKMNRLTAYATFPALGLLAAAALPLFHALFGTKWDAAVLPFQLLLIRGMFTVLTLVYSNHILALGRSRLLVRAEILRDALSLLAILLTLPMISNLPLFVGGQLAASAAAWWAVMVMAAKVTGRTVRSYLADLWLPALVTAAVAPAVLFISVENPWAEMAARIAAGAAAYLLLNLKNPLQAEAFALLKRVRE